MAASQEFPIVGVGAFAATAASLEAFLRGLPPAPGLSLVFITHADADHAGMLSEVVSRASSMPTRTITDGMRVEVDTVYLSPSGASIGIAERTFSVAYVSEERERNAFDSFLGALATDLGELSAGVVFAASDADGALGIRLIKESGGLTLAEASAHPSVHADDRPLLAGVGAVVDFSLPVSELGTKLVQLAGGSFAFAATDADQGEAGKFDEARVAIYTILRNQVGHDFSGYKIKTFLRRVQRRMQVVDIASPEDYVERLNVDPQEVASLFRDLLINVTAFFRDGPAFDALAAIVLPKLLEGRGAQDTIRIWVPGCATGEEVYSIAMLLREQMDKLEQVPRVQIFATDIDDQALAVARAGRYPTPLLASVSESRRRRFFIQDGNVHIIAKEARDLCIFSPHSVIRDPPFSRIDLVSCRNLLIYFGVDVQNQVIPTFHYALRPDGYLFLGTSENVSQFDELFIAVEKKQRIFKRRADVSTHVRLPMSVAALKVGSIASLTPARPPLGGASLRLAVDSHMLDRFTPPHVLVTRDADVVYYSNRTGKYLEAAPGVPTRQLFAMARKGLGLELRAVFREAVESGRSCRRDGVVVEGEDGRVQVTNLTVQPFSEQFQDDHMYLVVFEDQGPLLTREEALVRAQAMDDGTAVQFEKDLRDTRERLQSMMEEYETALEELKSSNEELVSVNEELQSSNEELEASKEELVSLNEELHTVNLELSGKIDALDRSNSDLQNLFESTSVATVFLDRNLVIRSFTPAMAGIFHIRAVDRGRPITELVSRLELPAMQADIAQVFNSDEPLERQANSKDGESHFLVRLAPYRDGERKSDGVVISFVDITGLVRAEQRQDVLIGELQHRTRNLLSVIQSIAQQTLESDKTLETFTSRLAALGRLQGLVGKVDANLIDINEIIALEFDALGVSDSPRITRKGPVVPLGFRNVQTIALVLHELATNAVKYGALKDDSAHLTLSWWVEDDASGPGTLRLDWVESGLRTVPDSTKIGFGRQLIEKALKYTLRAETRLQFHRDGVACHIAIPLVPDDETPPAA